MMTMMKFNHSFYASRKFPLFFNRPYIIAASFHSINRNCKDSKTLQDAVYTFNRMLYRNPVPPIPEFTKILSVIVKRNHFAAAISLIKHFDFLGVNPVLKPTIYVFNIAINCFCHLKRVDFGFAVLAKATKLGYQPDCATFNTLIRGLCGNDKLHQAIKLFDRIVKNGFEPSVVTYGTLINGLCKSGDTRSAVVLLQNMETSTCPPGLSSTAAL
ncbi:putative tetratricopeptide-like helical domain superfamily [Helianthus annuus]|nr:putative tetratricopeptide-like helical domain superfamily [Helianthus annuus]